MSTAVRAAEPTEDLEQRLSRARAALGAAERSAARWGGRIDRTALRGENLEQGSADDGLGTRLSVPAPLSTLFPRGSLRAGSSVALEGTATTSLLLSLAVAAAGEDSWCAIAGMPDLGLRSALDAGLDPCRLALAPADGEQRPQVLSALADGVGVLVLGPARKGEGVLMARTDNNRIVNFEGPLSLVDTMVRVKVTDVYPHSLGGQLLD